MAFIQNLASVNLGSAGDIELLQCRFDVAFYDDALYERLGVDFPEPLSGAVVKRKAEHLAGRYLGRLLLAGRSLPTAVATGGHREPLWPTGWVGSITHTADCAAVAIADARAVPSLGLDLERWLDERVARNIAASIVQPAEAQLLCGRLPFAHALTLAFSAKESVFKALFPSVQKYFDFDAVHVVDLDCDLQQIIFEVRQPLSDQWTAGQRLSVAFRCGERGVLTLCAGAAQKIHCQEVASDW
jgi:enterobactin synthetase component D